MDRELINTFMEKIIHGELPPGRQLPSENSLSEAFGLPRMTIRRSLNYLEEMGFLVSYQGKGRFVQERKKTVPLDLTGTRSFTEKIREKGYQLETLQVSLGRLAYHESTYSHLGLGREDLVFSIGRLRLVEKEPIALHVSFLPADLFPDFEEEIQNFDSLFDFFQSKGYQGLHSGPSQLTTSFPTREEQEILYCPPLVPLLILESHTFAQDRNRPIQFTKILYRSDRFRYSVGPH